MKKFSFDPLRFILSAAFLPMAEDGMVHVKGSDGEDSEVNVEDLLGVDMEQVDEYRSGPFPIGRYHFKCTGATVEKGLAGNPQTMRAYFAFEFECLNVLRMQESDQDPGTIIGRKHFERIYIIDAQRSLGEFRAFCNDLGLSASGEVRDILNSMIGIEFEGLIKHGRNKDDPDRPYVNLNRDKGKIIPISSNPAEADSAAA